ncbi:MAG: geranylgeranyl reductase family protein [Candidatus Hydrothermarchaeaceae archaeon]
MYDVVIVGGGPCGLIAGKAIAKGGNRVAIIEEHQEIGYPVQCSGLYSVSGLKALGLKLGGDIIVNTIKGGRFFSPSGKEIFAYSNTERARVVEKKLFDKYLAREAARAGVEMKLKTRVMGLERGRDISIKIEGLDGREKIESHLVIGADGVRSNVARWCGLQTPKKIVAAVQVEVDGVDVEDDVAEMYFGREYAPNFYAWVLPKGDVCEVGVGVRGGTAPPRKYLEKFIQKHPVASRKIKSRSTIELNMGGFPLSVSERTVSDGVMIVGDAAGHTKASTGGGVITGGIASMIAGAAAVKALEAGDYSEEFLRGEYESKWKEEIGFELKVHEALRNMFDSLSDEQLDSIFDLAIEARVDEIMVRYQDTDRPSAFVRDLMADERMVEVMQKFLDFPI